MKKPLQVLFLLMSLGLLVGCSGREVQPSSNTGDDSTTPSESESSEPAEVPVIQLDTTSATVKAGEFIEVNASLSIPNPEAVYTAVTDKTYATVTVNGSVIKVALAASAVVGEVVTVTVSSGDATPATLSITVEQNGPVETYYTVFFYQRYIGADNVNTLKGQLNTLLGDSFDHVVFEVFEESDANVKTAGTAMATYNSNHNNKVDALLGFNGDSENTLATAGYKKFNEQNYTYGTDKARKLWVANESQKEDADLAVKNYLFANYGPTKVNLNKATVELKPGGDAITVSASLDIAVVDEEPVFTVSLDENKTYMNVEVTGNSISVYAAADAVVGDEIIITVSCASYTPATFKVTIIAQDAVEEHHLVVAFYAKFVTGEKMTEIETNFRAYLTTKGISLDSVTFVSLGNSSTNVEAFAGLLTSYNGNTANAHPINAILGANGDSKSSLSNAGYKKESENSYLYGTDANRKIWVPKEYDATTNPDPGIKALVDFIAENYSQTTE